MCGKHRECLKLCTSPMILDSARSFNPLLWFRNYLKTMSATFYIKWCVFQATFYSLLHVRMDLTGGFPPSETAEWLSQCVSCDALWCIRSAWESQSLGSFWWHFFISSAFHFLFRLLSLKGLRRSSCFSVRRNRQWEAGLASCLSCIIDF